MTGTRAPHPSLSRRRFITIAAGAAGLSALPLKARAAEAARQEWHGIALGAQASITLEHPDEGAAKLALEASLAEVARLEAIFSLHRADSALRRLNTAGALEDAPLDLRILLAQALQLAERTGGAFDPSIQPLWALYAAHFSQPGAEAQGPSPSAIAKALACVGWQRVALEGARIRFLAPGMALTLNGIAQGYITDRVGGILKERGFDNVLVNMGEQLALGPQWSGGAWRIGIAAPGTPGRLLTELSLTKGAVATSSGSGLSFDDGGRLGHILDPRTGLPAQSLASVTVLAPSAAEADGLSTALSVLGAASAAPLLRPGMRAFALPAGGGPAAWI